MWRESEYLRAHPEVMREELRWMGIGLSLADLRPNDVLDIIAPVREEGADGA